MSWGEGLWGQYAWGGEAGGEFIANALVTTLEMKEEGNGSFVNDALVATLEMEEGGTIQIDALVASLVIEESSETFGYFINDALKATLEISGLNGTVGNFVNDALMASLALSGYSDTSGEFVNDSLMGQLTILQLSEYHCLVMCLNNTAITEYTNFDFNSLTKYRDNIIAVSSDGLYLLGSNDDDGIEIDSIIETVQDDFGSPYLKSVASIYVGIEGGSMNISTKNKGVLSSPQILPISTTLGTKRIKHGRGIKHKYWSIRLSNIDGSNFYIDTIEIPVIRHNRKLND